MRCRYDRLADLLGNVARARVENSCAWPVCVLYSAERDRPRSRARERKKTVGGASGAPPETTPACCQARGLLCSSLQSLARKYISVFYHHPCPF